MANNTRDVKLRLGVETTGEDEIDSLSQSIRQLAKEGGDAAPEFQALVEKVDQLAQQADAVRVLENLSREVDQLAQQQVAAKTAVEGLVTELNDLKVTTQAAASEQRSAKRALDDAVGGYKAVNDELRILRATYDENGKRAENYKAEVLRLTQAKIEQRKAVDEARAAYQQTNSQLAEAERAEARLQKQVSASAAELEKVDATLRERSNGFVAAQQELEKFGIASQTVAGAQVELVQQLNRVGKEAEALAQKGREAATYIKVWGDALDQVGRQAAEAEAKSRAAAQGISAAFENVGAKSAAQLRVEIQRVRDSMETLRTQAGLTSGELQAALGAGNNKLKELQRELREATNSLTLADRAADLLQNSLGQIAAGNLIADGIASIVERVKDMGRQFLQANLEIDRLNRTMMQITGSTQGAAEKIAFLRETANLAGIAVGDITDSFIRFQASAQASGLAAAEVDAIFRAVTVAGSKMGMTSDRVALALDALGQIASKGTVSMEELRQQLGDSLPGALAVSAKGLGLTTAELTKLVESGQLTATQFFPAFRRGLEETFGSSSKQVEGLFQAFQRLRNEFRELYQQAADSSAFKALTATLDFLATNFKTISTAVIGFGQALVAIKVAQFVASLAAASGATTKLASDTAAATVSTVANTAATVANTAAKNANATATTAMSAAAAGGSAVFGALRGSVTLVTGALGALATAGRTALAFIGGLPGVLAIVALNARDLGTAIGETAARWAGYGKVVDEVERKLQEQAAADKRRAEEKAAADAKVLQAAQRQTLALEDQSKRTAALQEVSEKAVNTAKTQADLLTRTAALRGEESTKLEAARNATLKVLEATEKESAARAAALTSLQAELRAKQLLIELNPSLGKEYKDNVQKLAELVEKRKEEKAQVDASIQSLRAEAAERRIAVESNGDLTESLDKYRDAAELNKKVIAQLRELQKSGVDVSAQLSKAEQDYATNVGLANKALEQRIQKMQLKNDADRIERDLAVTGLRTKLEQLKSEEALATANGNAFLATQKKIEQKQVEIEIIKATTEAQIKEAEGSIAVANAKLRELEASKDLDPIKRAQLQNQIKENELRIANAKAQLQSVGALEAEIKTLRLGSAARNEHAAAISDETAALERLNEEREREISAQEKAIQLSEREDALRRKRLNIDKEGFSLNTNGQRIEQFVANRRSVFEQAKSAGLDDATALRIAEQFIGERGDKQGLGGAQPGIPWEVVVQEAINNAVLEMARKNSQSQGQGGTGGSAGSSGGRTITINLNGTRREVNVASDADAAALESIFRDLESAARRPA